MALRNRLIKITLTALFILLIIKNDKATINDTNINNKSIVTNAKKIVEKINKFAYVYPRFKRYNNDIDSSTVKRFIEVIEYFKLGDTEFALKLYTAQICLESNAGKYIFSDSSNATGISQIMPKTALHYLQDLNNKKDFDNLGIGYYGHLLNRKYDNSLKNDIKDWLTNHDNNFILWGFIMRDNLRRYDYDISKTLLAYNLGGLGLTNYIQDGQEIRKHPYVRLIMNV